MRALAVPSYGPLGSLKIIEIPIPDPGPGQVRIRVIASALNPADAKSITGKAKFLHGRVFPLVMGFDFSGIIDSTGEKVHDLNTGDEVFGHLPYGRKTLLGSFAEYILANAKELAKKPAGFSHFTAAASATSGLTALQSMRDKGRLASGGRVLITGASGGVGSVAIGIALKLGARVTAVCSTGAVDFVKKLGAEEVIDRSKTDPIQTAHGPFNMVFDAAAAYSWKESRHLIKKNGAYVTTIPGPSFFRDKLLSFVSSTGVHFILVRPRARDLELLANWIESGLSVPVFQTVKIKDVASGLKRLEEGGLQGRIAVDVADGWK